jgi:hypothetical protein
VKAADLLANGCNLDVKNPRGKQDFEHMPPEKLVDDILAKELRIAEILGEIKAVLAKGKGELAATDAKRTNGKAVETADDRGSTRMKAGAGR